MRNISFFSIFFLIVTVIWDPQKFLITLAAPITLPRAYCAEEIWKRSLVSLTTPTVHTNRHENRAAFRKRCSIRMNLKRLGFAFLVWKESILKTELFENDGIAIITWFPCLCFSLNTNTKWPVIVAFSNFSGVVWNDRGRKMRFEAFSEWKRRFQISLV